MKKIISTLGVLLLCMAVNAQITMKIQSFTIKAGESKTILLEMDNPGFEAASFRCDLHFPEGITVNKNSRGTAYALSFNAAADRTDNTYHTLSSALQTDGALRITCFPPNADAFLGNSGAIVNVPITAASTVKDGEYTVTIDNQEITNADGTKIIKPQKYEVKIAIGDGTDVKNVNGKEEVINGKFIKDKRIVIKKADKTYDVMGVELSR